MAKIILASVWKKATVENVLTAEKTFIPLMMCALIRGSTIQNLTYRLERQNTDCKFLRISFFTTDFHDYALTSH